MILQGDCRLIMQDMDPEQFHTCVTSPPYWGLRDYGIPPSYWPETTYTPMPGLLPVTVPEWTGCLGLEPTPEMFVGHMVLVFREVWRLLRKDGTLWMNFGDSYAGGSPRKDEGFNKRWHGKHYLTNKQGEIDRNRPDRVRLTTLKPKDLVGIPWRVSFALQADGWYLRMDNIWNKPNCMPESTRDRPTKAHEYIFLLSKNERYYYDYEAIKEPLAASSIVRLSQDLDRQEGSRRANGRVKTNGNIKAVGGSKGAFGPPQSRNRGKGNAKTFRGGGKYTSGKSFDNSSVVDRESHGNKPNESGLRNKRSVWTVATAQCTDAHFATFPEKLIEPCILAGAPVGGRVLDPFGGSGTTRKVALQNNRECTLIEMNPDYIKLSK
ncbi:DNA-methyltransferase [Paenibacillus larvae]|uniref:Methyltransferase n=1 Tax=Paenibacillus larvae subsp. larvae TaxID=147375 RepID=A0A2L1U7F1_9BACL|nr:site-specific DNA-methyltransferase [Paenibacillus larvae]AVF28856.1 DNA adenine methyltransferase YhdJ [Paenibacillus larvae subsp. larvae]MCY9500315.1 site-specific DNA-methyltransferase [Paenibacillus larvae]MDR5608752.1 site-specific DNA-methyltransferase [Paenibacillus larvae]